MGDVPAWLDADPGPAGEPRVERALGPADQPTADRLRWMVDSIQEVIFEADPEGRWTYLNPAWTALLGHTVAGSLGQPFLEYVHPDDRQGNLDKFLAVVNGPHDSCRFEARYLTADGGVRHMEIHAWIFRGPNREPLGSTGTLTDVTGRRQAEDALAVREQRLAALVQNAADAILVCRPDGTITWAGPGYARLVGLEETEVVGSCLLDHVAPEDRGVARAALVRGAARLATAEPVELRVIRPGGGRRHLETIITGRLCDPAVDGIVVNARDVSERKAFELELERRASHDALTELPNRALLLEHVTELIGRRNPHPNAVVFLDLDRFKLVNDSLGHDAGDQVLRAVAGRLQAAARPGDVVARFGGDEFVVVAQGLDLPAAVEVADRLRAAIAAPISVEGRDLTLTASAGVRIFGSAVANGRAVTTAGTLLRDADSAMYDAKEAGRDRVAVSDLGAGARVLARLDTEMLLRKTIEGNGLLLYCQPELSLRTGQLIGLELLVRWPHPTRGLLAPAAFIGLAEETGLIVPLGRWVLRRACQQLAAWQREGWGSPRLSVNVSPRQLQTGMVAELTAALADSGADPSGLCLELTESALLHDITTAAAVMGALTDLGVTLSIDDFGTGFSSLSYLQRLPLHQLKIDQTFVAGLCTDEGRAIVSAVVGVADALRLETVAEGVEETGQARQLLRLGCHAAQGYLYARPFPLDEFRPATQPLKPVFGVPAGR
jgi:diguanylate cyclase (GGDEF)-like protein/PAS domain S-box-containing protein